MWSRGLVRFQFWITVFHRTWVLARAEWSRVDFHSDLARDRFQPLSGSHAFSTTWPHRLPPLVPWTSRLIAFSNSVSTRYRVPRKLCNSRKRNKSWGKSRSPSGWKTITKWAVFAVRFRRSRETYRREIRVFQPSSSARAQLLLSTSDSYHPAIPDNLKFPFAEILDCNVSPDFQVVLKKMNKKDSTTKLKVGTVGAAIGGGDGYSLVYTYKRGPLVYIFTRGVYIVNILWSF